MIVYKKRIENLFYGDNYDTVVLYGAGAAINTVVKLYLYATKYLNAKKCAPNEIITYSVPVRNTADENELNEALKTYLPEHKKVVKDSVERKIISAMAIKLQKKPLDPKISKDKQSVQK